MGEFSISPEIVQSGAETLGAASEEIYRAMNTLAEASGKLEGTAEAGGFAGIAECVQAVQLWESDYIAVHRADIEDAALCAAVSAASSEEVDTYVSSMFSEYADSYFPEGRTTPAPERPAPDPSTQMPRGGESVAV
ncbi:hypothetical protein [Glycomyces niveus]|uniref:PE domain-containing protein n=1 Tax=Glycomyces niveus TaxID=2820287 RepID=A0ABS3U612_9ACTN|nr:hypothetical protein [Glycomyces sp. NEAU-S30]MBO3733127.1 hypothetical protein [Glycomyces sp. NEAU-S30]